MGRDQRWCRSLERDASRTVAMCQVGCERTVTVKSSVASLNLSPRGRGLCLESAPDDRLQVEGVCEVVGGLEVLSATMSRAVRCTRARRAGLWPAVRVAASRRHSAPEDHLEGRIVRVIGA